jgi:4-amino-4-deoxy-L-arabinose transferase-like glycosyltransferase
MNSISSRSGPSARAIAEGTALLGILSIAAYLRFTNLESNPGWYSDEGTVAEISRHMAEGRTQYLAITESTLLVARFPVVPFLVSRLLPLGGGVLETLRVLTASLGVASTLAVFWLVRLYGERRAALQGLLAALLFAIYPPAVFYARIGFSYNLLTPLVLIVVGNTWLYLDRRKRIGLFVAALAIGLGAVTDLMMLSIAAPVIVVIAFTRARDLLWWVPLTIGPLVIYGLALIAANSQVFFFDLDFILSLMAAVPWWAQLPMVALNFGTLALDDPWWIPAIIGLFLLRGKRWKRLLLLSFLLPLVLLARTAGLAGVRLYSISPLFPFIAIGMGTLLWQGVPWLLDFGRRTARDLLATISWLPNSERSRWLQTRSVALASSGLVFLIVLTPFLISSFQLASEARDGFRNLDEWAYLPVPEAMAAVEFVNSHSSGNEMVIASPALAWAVDSRRVDFQQVLAFDGIASVDYPADIPLDRFAFEADFERARFAVVDPIWREWGAVHIPEVAIMLQAIEEWPIVMKAGSIEVRANAN